MSVRIKKSEQIDKKVISSRSISNVPLERSLKHFLGRKWKKITQDPNVMHRAKGYRIPFYSKPFQSQAPSHVIAS